MTTTSRSGLTLRTLALAYLLGLLAVPILVILFRTFEPGLGAFIESIRTPAAIAALNLSAAHRRHRRAAQRRVRSRHGDRPRPVAASRAGPHAGRRRPAVRGVAHRRRCVADHAVGRFSGWFGGLQSSPGIQVIFGLPGMVIATIFVTLPFVVREVEPVLHEIGTEQEQAAATLGASGWQTFWRITLPAIRWGLTYGVVLTVARALGEFGAVIMVSSGFPGVSQTLTLLVHSRYIDDHNTYGAYAAATLLMGIALMTLLLMTLLDRKRSPR